MSDETEVPDGEEMEVELEAPAVEEPLLGPDCALDCIEGRYDFIAFWLEKLGVDDPRGSAMRLAEGGEVEVLHPVTGEWMTPAKIAKKAGQTATLTRIQ